MHKYMPKLHSITPAEHGNLPIDAPAKMSMQNCKITHMGVNTAGVWIT